jgi:D-alanine--poly(phosphoribitol) ligase subunit 1
MNKYNYNLGLLFRDVADRSNLNPALRLIDGTTVNYKQLNIVSNKIACYLIKNQINKGDIIAIFNDKSAEAYAIMIACLKIGATYSNFDYNSPIERLKKMISICEPKIYFTNAKYQNKLTELDFIDNVIDYSGEQFIAEIQVESSNLPAINCSVTGNTPAYLMFTSGSTGFPKGVAITHSNVLNFIEWSKTTYSTTVDDVFTNINPMHFDNSVFDFYASLFTGASLIPVNEDLTINPRKLIEALNKVKPTIWFSVPSMLVYVLKLRALKESDLSQLRIVTFGGEGFPKNQLRNLWAIWGKRVKFINVYGPTECTCICSSYIVTQDDIKDDELLPLGPMAPNFGHLIFNEAGNLAEENEIGELYITGPNVGLGYYNNIEKTREAFIQNPLLKTYVDIVYKSGDLVKFNKDENLLYFCGRTDNQIKRMGYRIELEEIENAFGSLGYIEENAVIYIKSDDSNGSIVACIRSLIKDENKIIDDLSKIIPSYMLPNFIRFYDHLPKNQNGKIDRLQLKEEFLK